MDKKCEKCGVLLERDNNSPSEIHDLCLACWLKTSEGRATSEGYKKILLGE